MNTLRVALPIFLAALVVSCEPEFDVQLASSNERLPAPTFSVVGGADGVPSFDTIRITDPAGVMVWHAVAEVFGSSGAAQFAYGVAPAGFVDEVSAEPLQSGVRYRIVVVGTERAERYFEANADGRVSMASN